MSEHIEQRSRWFSAELLTAYRFAKEGYVVSTPLAPCSYDLLVDDGTHIWRVQVKHASFKPGRVKPSGRGHRAGYEVKLVRGSGSKRAPLRQSEFDLLCVVCEADRIYVIPPAAILSPNAGRLIHGFRIRPEATTRKDCAASTARWEPYLNQFCLLTTT